MKAVSLKDMDLSDNALFLNVNVFKLSSKNQTRVLYKFWKTPDETVTLSMAFAVYFLDFPHDNKFKKCHAEVLVGETCFPHAANLSLTWPNLRPDLQLQ